MNITKKEIIGIVEETLLHKILDITNEYKGKNFKHGVSVFIGSPADIIKEIENRLDKFVKETKKEI